MPRNLYKVQKLISKKRGKLDALHENSRDSKRLQRASARNDKLARAAAATLKARQVYGNYESPLLFVPFTNRDDHSAIAVYNSTR
jgi:translation machinery-associated protein 16